MYRKNILSKEKRRGAIDIYTYALSEDLSCIRQEKCTLPFKAEYVLRSSDIYVTSVPRELKLSFI